MKTRLITLLKVFAFAFVVAIPASSGNRVGNGGDHDRAMFIKMGHAVVNYLKVSQQGNALLARHNLSADELLNILTIDVIKVSDEALVDNGGSEVDAIGEPGHITLAHDAWFEHFEHERDVYYLVFHEMLRALGVDDDNYIISESLHPFPAQKMVTTRIIPAVPLIEGDLLSEFIKPEKFEMFGTGCPERDQAYLDYDSEKNILDISYRSFFVQDGPGVGLLYTRKNCNLAIPFTKLPAQKRLVITQIDIGGEVSLPKNSSMLLKASAYLVGGIAPPEQTKTVGSPDKPVSGTTLMRINSVLKTPCGADPKLLNIVINSRVDARGGASLAKAALRKTSVYLKLESCE